VSLIKGGKKKNPSWGKIFPNGKGEKKSSIRKLKKTVYLSASRADGAKEKEVEIIIPSKKGGGE